MNINKEYPRRIYVKAFSLINHIIVSYKDNKCKVPNNITSILDIKYDKEKNICKLDIHKPKFISKSFRITKMLR